MEAKEKAHLHHYSVLVIKLQIIQTMNLQERKNENVALFVYFQNVQNYLSKCWWERKKWEGCY